MIEDLEQLLAELKVLTDLPPVLFNDDSPVVVRSDDVATIAERMAAGIKRIAAEHARTTARLGRYDELKTYTRRLERRLAAISELSGGRS